MVESFMKAYGEAVQHLQELQPDAVIYLQAIMKVTTERSEQATIPPVSSQISGFTSRKNIF